VHGTLAEAMEVYGDLPPVRLLKLRAFRPFPAEALKAACIDLTDLVVLERALSPGCGGIVGTEVRAALADMSEPPRVHSFAAGLGGRDVPLEIYPRLVEAALGGRPEAFRIFDVNLDILPEHDR
jgi:pyruvate ferredoxin oxidoreductase alpha subunit